MVLWCLPFSAQPRIQVKEPKQSFGRITKGTLAEMRYLLVNVGDQPLLLLDAEVACDCTRAEWMSQPIAPGDSSTVTVFFDTKSAYGRQDRTVVLRSNDPRGPVTLRFKGTVLKK